MLSVLIFGWKTGILNLTFLRRLSGTEDQVGKPIGYLGIYYSAHGIWQILPHKLGKKAH